MVLEQAYDILRKQSEVLLTTKYFLSTGQIDEEKLFYIGMEPSQTSRKKKKFKNQKEKRETQQFAKLILVVLGGVSVNEISELQNLERKLGTS